MLSNTQAKKKLLHINYLKIFLKLAKFSLENREKHNFFAE
jgi:hypothetical protein